MIPLPRQLPRCAALLLLLCASSFLTTAFGQRPPARHTLTTTCGNNVCESPWSSTGESCGNCPADCGPCQKADIAYVCDQPGEFSFTFDDGPSNGPSQSLLTRLSQAGVPASFFLVGRNIVNNRAIVRSQLAAGHTIQSHTFSHADLQTLPIQDVYGELTRATDAFAGASCIRPVLLRPPYGSTNATVQALVYNAGMRSVMWNVDGEDWRYAQAEPNKVIDIVSSRLRASPYSVISLQHDLFQFTVDLVPRVIETVRSFGYTKFVTIEQCLWGPNFRRHPSYAWQHRLCTQSTYWPAASSSNRCPLSEWSEWSRCNAPCSHGEQTRVRFTLPPGGERTVSACAGVSLIQRRTVSGPDCQ
jgi:peptidoglycan/xylan/chitin deacetylase (PgdA/CDA1 family)